MDSSNAWSTDYQNYSRLLRRDGQPVSCPDCPYVMYPRSYPEHKRNSHGHDPLTECSFCGEYRWKRGRKMHQGRHLRACLLVFLRDRAVREPCDAERASTLLRDVLHSMTERIRELVDKSNELEGRLNARDATVALLSLKVMEIWPQLVECRERVRELEDAAGDEAWRRASKRTRLLDDE